MYWADILYKCQLHSDNNYPFDQLFDEEPYVEASPDTLLEYKNKDSFAFHKFQAIKFQDQVIIYWKNI